MVNLIIVPNKHLLSDHLYRALTYYKQYILIQIELIDLSQ